MTNNEAEKKMDEGMENLKIVQEMEAARKIVTEVLQLRAKAGIKARQPLAELKITKYELREEIIEIIKEEVNVKDVIFVEGEEEKIELNTEITPELKLEGQAREIIRFIQEMRKEAGYDVDNHIKIWHTGMSEVFEAFGKMIAKETLSDAISEGKNEQADLEKELKVDNQNVAISLKRD